MNKIHISNSNKYILAMIMFFVFILSSVPISTNVGIVQAQSTSKGEYTLLEPLPCIPGNGITCPADNSLKTSIDFKTYIQYAFNLLIGLSAAAAVFMMIFGGLQYMSTDSWQGKQDGLEKFKHAIYGLLLVLGSYLILRTIDPRLVEIPSTIVPPIVLKKQVDSISNFFSQIMTDAEKNQAELDNAKEKIDEINNKKNKLVSERELLINEYNKAQQNNDSELMAETGLKLQQNSEEIKKVAGDYAVTINNVEIRTELSNYNPEKTTAVEEASNIEKIKQKYINILKANNQNDKVKEVEDISTYAQGLVNIQEQVTKIAADAEPSYISKVRSYATYIPLLWIPSAISKTGETAIFSQQKSSAVKNIEYVMNNYSQKITDPELKNNLQQTAKFMIASINEAKKK